jgi:crotonobetainyl-CoA:carnitine CoA-transferase CaiB-like acyl-CoA transferase
VTQDSSATPRPLRWAVWLLLGEAAGVAVLAAYLVYEDLTGEANDIVVALIETGFAVAAALVLLALARALANRRAGARGPAIVLQLMLLPIGYYMIQGGLAWLGAPILALAVLVCALLVTPSTTKALGLAPQ